MQKYLTILLAIIVGILLFDRFRSKSADHLPAGTSALVAPASIDLQDRCARQAEAAFRKDGYTEHDMATYQNHYNNKLGRCFLLESSTVTTGGGVSNFMSLADAFESKEYGSYAWLNTSGKQYWEVKPSTCHMTMPQGDEKNCSSAEEFKELAKAYME